MSKNSIIHEATFDVSQKWISKPKGNFHLIQKNLKTPVDIERVSQLTEFVVSYGFTWSPATFKNDYRNNKNWLQQSIFVLDFDDGITPEKVIERCNRNGLIPNLIYTTFSDSVELRKFRLVFFLDKIIDDRKIAKFIQLNLMKLFNECDVSCKDFSRLFYGGNDVIFVSETINEYNRVLELLNTVVVGHNDKTDKPNKTRGIQKVLNITSTLSDTIVNKGDSKKQHFLVEQFDYNKASLNIKILDDFIKGKWLYHLELFGLATNLYYINGGLKFMNDTMNKHNKSGKTRYTDNNFGIIATKTNVI